jgi:hypothetical protein
MVRRFTQIIVLFFLASFSICADTSSSKDQILKKILERAKKNENLTDRFGFYQTTRTKKMDDGKVISEELNEYRLIWLNNHAYMELVKKDGRDLDESEKREETNRKAKFVKSLNKKDDDDDDITLDDLYVKYDFAQMPADNIGEYVFSFKPKDGKLTERSRIEKVINHVTGTFWADQKFQIVRAQANLMDNVKFGLGILGNLEKLQVEYEQQTFQEVQMPATFSLYFKARIALLRSEERQIESTYSNYFRKPELSSK